MTQATIRFYNIPSGPNRHFHTMVPTPTSLRPPMTTSGDGNLNVANPGIEYLPTGPEPQWRFVFWSWPNTTSTDLDVVFPTVPSGSNRTITAWYRRWPGGGDGSGEVGMETWAFSEAAGNFITEVPIASVEPTAAWLNPPNDAMPVTNDSAVEITAKASIGTEEFKRWVVAPLNSTSSNRETTSLTMHGERGEDAVCIAFYGKRDDVDFPDIPRRIQEFEEWLRGRGGSWVADPVPFDILRQRFLRDEFSRTGRSVARGVGEVRDELSHVLSNAANMASHEVQGWLSDIRGRLSRLAEAEKLLVDQIKDKGGKG